MPSGRDSLRRNRVAPRAFTNLAPGRRHVKWEAGHGAKSRVESRFKRPCGSARIGLKAGQTVTKSGDTDVSRRNAPQH
jgi:hypothetical protein